MPRPLLLAALLLVACGDTEPPEVPAPAEPQFQIGGRTETGERFGVQVGGDVAVPEGFPSDVPIYPGARPTAAAAAGSGGLISLRTSDAPAKVLAFYRAELTKRGWVIEGEGSFGGHGMVAASKAERSASVAVISGADGTQINLTVSDAG